MSNNLYSLNFTTIPKKYRLPSQLVITKPSYRLNEYTNVEEMAPTSPPDQTRGYLWVGEKSPVFGYSWNRCWCRVVDGMLVIQVEVHSSVSVSVRLSVCLSVSLSVCLSVRESERERERRSESMLERV